MIGCCKKNRNNYQRKCFSTKEKETGIERYPQVNQPLNNWLLDGNNQPLNIWAEKATFVTAVLKCFVGEQVFFLYSLKINECLNFSSTDSEEK